MDHAERFRKLAIKRGLTPGALLDASPEDFDLLLLALRREFAIERSYTEREVNEVLKAANAFGDHVTLRRELIDHRLMQRKSDCTDYRKLPARPDDEVRALLTAWRTQRRASNQPRVRQPVPKLQSLSG